MRARVVVVVGVEVPQGSQAQAQAGPQGHHVLLEYYARPRRIQTIHMDLHRSIIPPLAIPPAGQIGRDRLALMWRRGTCRI